MKLLLTSDGMSTGKIRKEFLKLLDKPAAENKVLIMHTVRDKSQIKYVKKSIKQFILAGIKKGNIHEVNISKNVHSNKFGDFDIFLSMGGNTYYILDRVKKTGFDKYIKNFVKKNKIYVGISAGSIIVHKTIEIAGWGKDRDINEIGLRDLKGLNITNIAIFPHFKEKRKKEINLFKKTSPYPIVELKDGQALLINDKIKRLIK